MKKKLLASLLASASVLGVCVLGGTALADETDNAETEVGIGFSGHDPGTTGDPLEIKWAPINFDFGSANTVNTVAATFNEDSGSNKYVVVSDGRTTPTTDEWKLTASLSNMMSGSAQLTGATLEFGTVKKAYNGSAAPETPGSITAPTAQHTAVMAAATQTLTQGGTAVPVMQDDGVGTTSYKGMTAMEMESSSIKLNVPASVAQAGKQYTGTLTWSLDDTI
ncbi:WxL domain-containing protein [Enterococcus sp. 669A]|uniref:WxL domain-containing protein n=1 Tax=Candidatus Enterococcus moelleringii TaxID=2815325 RepID=A0ABS3L906_9ENTE|nr:WxL domain-containing protein [Enterococcus sp. 669A]MBO1306117.1 WxL domain-containing protein [Enterococcus sp. 669A]